MMRFRPDWHYVRQFTLVPLLCAVIAVTTLVAANWMHDKELQTHEELSANFAAVHEDYDALIDQRRVVDRYHRRYQSFRNLGFVGRESRLDWVETLRTISAGVGIPRVSYTIEPQLGVVAPVTSLLNSAEIQIRVSKLHLEMGLVHELDLLRFFDRLQEQAPGLIKVDECALVFDAASVGEAQKTHLTTNCTVQIYSVITSDVTHGASG